MYVIVWTIDGSLTRDILTRLKVTTVFTYFYGPKDTGVIVGLKPKNDHTKDCHTKRYYCKNVSKLNTKRKILIQLVEKHTKYEDKY